MVCFVHDRHFLSKFHGYINQLRQSNEFKPFTLHQLPKLCCSCPEKRKNTDHIETEPLLTSLDINALQLVALRFDLKRCITTNTISSSSTFPDYTILSFPSSFQAAKQAIATDQFITQLGHEICSIQEMYHVCLEFVTPFSSKELLNEIAQRKYDLAVESSDYSEVSQAINGLWVIISTENSSCVIIVKHVLEKKWNRFIGNLNSDALYTVPIQQHHQNFRPTFRKNRYTNLRQPKNRYQQTLKQQQKKWQMRQRKQVTKMSQEDKTFMIYSEDEDADIIEDFTEDIFSSTLTKLHFLFTRSDNCKEYRRPRTHRRQHLLALAIVA